MNGKRRVLSAATALALAVALGACSSSSKQTPAANSSSTSSGSTAKATGAPIKVGLLCTCSGAGGFGAEILPAKDVYQAWANTVNASGGIDGHPVQLITEDDGGSPGTALSNAQTLISDHVVAVADISVDDQVFASALQQAKIPVVGVETPNSPFGTNPDFYPEAQTNNSAIAAVMTTAKAAGATNLANVYCAESPVCAQSVPAFTAAGKQFGVPVTYNAEVSATAPNYTAQCVAAQQQHVSAVFIGDAANVITRIATSCSQQGYNPIYIVEGAGWGENEASAPGLSNGEWIEFPATPYFATNVPAVQAADNAIDKYYPGLRTNTNLFNMTDFMAWASGTLLEHAVKAGGLSASATPTPAEVIQGLDSLKNDNLGGLTVPLTFTAGKANTVSCWMTARQQNGKPALVNGGKVSCAS